ncbi:protein mono-ADP-ribosyltransferase PARP10 [Monodelphis domestica]|uniref:Poly [ADP-ribose] polymerase n=1 Tax=Monodelphis domestica TaxID=13616 RepID=F7A7Q9_MONDO|nr:protein mono-ADP-ribosyltransferase PARP10 [Monodelphis domestica]
MTELGAEKQVELRGLPQAVSDELVTLYFENSRRSGGGPLGGWQRLGMGGILTFQKSEDAQRVLAQASHELQGTAVSVVPSPPRASQRLLLQGLRPGTAPQLLELYVESLLRAEGHCQALASPRPDRALVQLSSPLSEAEFEELAVRASEKTLNGAAVSLAWVPHARAVRIVRRDRSPDATLLRLYLENERRSGGGAVEGLRTLPRAQGTVVTFQQWKVAERVLSRNHQLSDSELSIVPHYDVLEPEPEPEPESKPEEGERPAQGETISKETSGEKVLRETCGETVPLESPEGTVPLEKPEVTVTRETPKESSTVERIEAVEPLQGLVLEETMPVERSKETTEATVPQKVVPREREEELAKTAVPVQILLPMEPGALRFLQLYYQEFLASLEEVTLCPLDGPDVFGFRLSGVLEPCHAAKDFLQSLLISIGSHTLPLKHPGSAYFLLGSEGQDLLRNLEAQFHCILTVEEQGVAAVNADPVELDQESSSDWTHNFSLPSSTIQDTSDIQIEKIKKFLNTLDGPDEEELSSLELKEAELDELEENVAAQPDREKTTLEEDAALQLALHHSLEAEVLVMGETRALKQALMMSLLDDIEANGSSGRLRVHSTFDHDPNELSHALDTALRAWLQEERVMGVDQGLPPTFWSRLERHHGVTITLQGDCAILSGYGPHPSYAAHHLKTLMTVPLNQSHPLAPDPARAKVVTQVMREQPLELECLEESSAEFQETVQAFYNTLDKPYNVHVIKVERVSQPLLQSQYELHKKKLEQTCSLHPVERILYHGTSWQAVPEICSQGFNRSFCGRNAAMYGNGVYFAVKAKISIKDRYSPPDMSGHKAVFVARVLTGDYGPGHPGLRVPPQKESGPGVQRYDSAVDSTKKPRVFVIFHDTQALPIFLITCRHIPGPSIPHDASCSGFNVPSLHPPI